MKNILIVLITLLLTNFLYSQNNEDDGSSDDSTFLRNDISIGFENYSKSKGVNGGNYLHGGYHYRLNPRLAIGAKLSSDLTPKTFDDVMIHSGIRYSSNAEMKKFGQVIGMYYMRNLNSEKVHNNFIGLEVSLLNYYYDETKEVSIFPITLLYSIEGEQLSLIYELFRMRFNF